MTKNKRSIVLIVVCLLTLCVQGAVFAEGEQALQEEARFIIFHTNDTHARVSDKAGSRIGFAKMKALIDAERKKPNQGVLVFDAGDTLHGTSFATLSKGESIMDILNIIPYDAMAPGNHDFNYGYKRLLELARKAKFPLLSANVLKEGSNRTVLPQYKIIKKNGVRFGVFGLSTPETAYKTHPKNVKGLVFQNPIEAAKRVVAVLEKKGVDVIIGVGHIGIDKETEITSEKIAEAVPQIDLFVDGHSHSALPTGKKINKTLIVQTGEYLKNLGKVVLVYAPDGSITIEAGLIPADTTEQVEKNASIETLVTKIVEKNKALLNKVIGTTAVLLHGERAVVRAGESNLGNLITQAMQRKSSADVVLTNGGGIRASIAIGDITKGSVNAVLPFGNNLVVLEVTGAQLKQALENGIRTYPSPAGAFPHIAGMRVVFGKNNKVKSMTLNDGRPIEEKKTYVLATNDFIAAGGDGYAMFENARKLGEYENLDEILIDEIANYGTEGNAVDGRIVQK